MTNELQLFNFEGKEIRALEINGQPYFVGKDAAEILGYKKARNAIASHVENEDKTTALIQGAGSNYKSKSVIINESGLYALIFGSKLPSAGRFKHWVTSEVLPAIRKHGVYMTDRKAYDITHDKSGNALADLLQQAADQLKQKNIQIEEMKPKAFFADAVTASEDNISIGQLAGFLKQNGRNIGQNRLFKWLREHHYLCAKGDRYNLPTQRAMDLGLFKVKERIIHNSDGSAKTVSTTKVTGKGQQYFINKLLK